MDGRRLAEVIDDLVDQLQVECSLTTDHVESVVEYRIISAFRRLATVLRVEAVMDGDKS